MLSKRRKVDAECRVFNEEWKNKYFFMNHFGKPTCLICSVSVAVNKEFNIKRHYDRKESVVSPSAASPQAVELSPSARSKPTLLGWAYPDSIRPCTNGVSLLYRIASVAPLSKLHTMY